MPANVTNLGTRGSVFPSPTTTGSITAQDVDKAAATSPVKDSTAQGVNTIGHVPATTGGQVPPRRAVMNGFAGNPVPKVNLALTLNPGQVGSTESKTTVDPKGWTSRGFIDVKYQPAVGGVDIEVESHHSEPVPSKAAEYRGDGMLLYLQARVLDGGTERIITLSTLMDDVMNPDGAPVGRQRFHVNYDDINKWLKSRNPQLTFCPGDPLAVFAVWKEQGHQWGGFCRGGYFESPPPLGKKNLVDVRAGSVTGPRPTTRNTGFVQKPIDITLKIPESIIAKYDKVLDKDAKLVSRREHEQKFCPRSMDELQEAVKGLLHLCSSTPEEQEEYLLTMMGRDEGLSQAAGYDISGWHIKTTDRYYVKDSAGKNKIGANGLPIIAPMVDAYQDDAHLQYNPFPIARNNMAARFRDGEIKSGESVASMGKLNMKTARVVDPFTLTQTGLEISLDTRFGVSNDPEALQQLADLLGSEPAPYSPLPELKKNCAQLRASAILGQAVVNVANRYKFTLEHANGLELEVSMDVVHAGIVCKQLQPSSTQGMDEAQKYERYAALMDAEDASLIAVSSHTRKTDEGEKNQVVFTDGEQLVMAQLWLDEEGNKHVSEHPCVRFPQVEIEMDHVQARTTGSVKAAYNRPTTTAIITNDADQDQFLAGVSDQVTMNGPPMTHTYEDLTQVQLYEDESYVQMQDAVVRFRDSVFPNGVRPARQKAAQALENAGLVPKERLTLTASMPWTKDSTVAVGYNNYGAVPKVTVRGDQLNGTPAEVAIVFDDFPIRVPCKGHETAKEIAELIRDKLDQAIFYKAELSETQVTATPHYYSYDDDDDDEDEYTGTVYEVAIKPRELD